MGPDVVEEDWLVSAAFGDKALLQWAAADEQRSKELTLMPFATAAARVTTRLAGGPWKEGVLAAAEGRAFVTLPLPVESGLPVHINGRWQIGDDRNSLAPRNHSESFEWNRKLGGQVAAAAYARLVRALATGLHPPLLGGSF
eukprot:5507932-Prymnesium_polylepis.1